MCHGHEPAQVIDDALRREPGLSEPSSELRARKHIEQLGQQYLTRAKFKLTGLRAIEKPTWQPSADDAGDEQIRIEDKTHQLPTAQASRRLCRCSPSLRLA